MSTDLRDQVRAYTKYLVEGIDPVDLDEIVDRDPSALAARSQDGWGLPRWAAGLAAALAVILAVGGTALGIWLFAGSGDRELVETPTSTVTVPTVPTTSATLPPTTAAPLSTTTVGVTTTTIESATTPTEIVFDETVWVEEDGPAALALIDRYYQALNSGDIDTALGFASIRNLAARLPIVVEGVRSHFAYDCTLLNDRPVVKCLETVADDLYGPAGLTHRTTLYYQIRNGKLTTAENDDGWAASPFVCSADPPGNSATYLIDLRVWAASTHPELERYWEWGSPIDSRAAIPCTPYPFHNAEGARTVCELVDDFLAQSDRWPIDQ